MRWPLNKERICIDLMEHAIGSRENWSFGQNFSERWTGIEHRVRGPVKIAKKLSETCGDGVMNVSNVRSWIRQFKEGRTSCDNKPRQSRPRTSRSDDMIKRVGKVVLEDRRMSVEHIVSKVGIFLGTVHTILNEDLKLRKVSSRWVPRKLTNDHKAARVVSCQAMLTRDDSMNRIFFSSNVTMDETWMQFFNPETKRWSAQWKRIHSPSPKEKIGRCPKETYVGLTTLKLGVMDTICHFKCGNEVELNIYLKMSITPGKHTMAGVNAADEIRTLKANKQCTPEQQQRRRYRKAVKKRKIDLNTQEEAIIYVAGGFRTIKEESYSTELQCSYYKIHSQCLKRKSFRLSVKQSLYCEKLRSTSHDVIGAKRKT
ncbi:hypothetical protein ANN_22108 [Periplaneta americana]|uniref:Uncharacterized protein n=1 Tax=Periplaneta americana TaxID=6978 RepID=A0ABQ8S7Q5_PERAM|nr:hypothetical protein ANN_22108 [Periplaneta americana]